MTDLTFKDFDFDLPDDLIARVPAPRGRSRLLNVLDSSVFEDLIFSDLPTVLPGDAVLIFNQTKVMKARLFGSKESGGSVELLIERVYDPKRICTQIRASKSPKVDSQIRIADCFLSRVREVRDGFYILELQDSIFEIMDRHGHMPLPPYINRDLMPNDEMLYQTVFAKELGAVAAPTAGLHFSNELISRLKRSFDLEFLTLHVGAGTFMDPRVKRLRDHRMHSEFYLIDESTALRLNEFKSEGRTIVAVGTTTLRAIESASMSSSLIVLSGWTNIFIKPGYKFKFVDKLITNFHLPQSTLLVLVSAFAGKELIDGAYAHAIKNRYRFFSYGDAMLLSVRS